MDELWHVCNDTFHARCHQTAGYVMSGYDVLCASRGNCWCKPVLVCEICKGDGEEGEEVVDGVQGEASAPGVVVDAA